MCLCCQISATFLVSLNTEWQKYTEELYKKDLHNPDNHDGDNHLEPDILEFEVSGP